jgi:hypothetical protein
MAIITPVGSEFDWSPKQKVVKTASTKEQPKSDKDLLYEAAKKVVKAQFMDLDKPMDAAPCGDAMPCPDAAPSAVEGGEMGGAMGDVVPDAAPDAKDVAAPAEGGAGDVEKAVKELVDKANKAEEVAAKVQDAVGKVEEAVQEVKDAVGAPADGGDAAGAPEEIEIEVEDLGGDKGEEKDEEEKEDKGEEKEDKGEEIVKESKEPEKKEEKEACASKKVLEMKSAAMGDDLAKFAALSPSVKKKIYDYWKNDLKYAPDYCKLLVTDN